MTIDYLQAVVLGLLQGVAELFPVSSLGHSVVLPQLLGWDIQQDDDAFLTFLVATHLATALVLVGFFRRDWVRIVRGLARSIRDRHIGDADARLGWLLVVGTIPAGILGLLLEDALRGALRLGPVGVDLPDGQRRDAPGSRGPAPAGAAARGRRRRRPHRPASSAGAGRRASGRPRPSA